MTKPYYQRRHSSVVQVGQVPLGGDYPIRIHAFVENGSITVGQDFTDLRQTAKLHLPCLITVEKDICTPRLPSYRLKAASAEKQVKIVSFADFPDRDPAHYGAGGSATSVERIFPPESRGGQIRLEGDSESIANELAGLFAARKYM